MMEIRPTEIKDLPLVMEIYDYARAFMRATGNTTQWIDGYPSEALICQEIEDGHSFVCTGEQGGILGTFCCILGEDPTYQQIYEGAWLNDEPYGVIHRLATNGKQKGASEPCLH
ncbi:GNAT family N-acetyltransferase, partial [Bacteroides thetaiotaomicron]